MVVVRQLVHASGRLRSKRVCTSVFFSVGENAISRPALPFAARGAHNRDAGGAALFNTRTHHWSGGKHSSK